MEAEDPLSQLRDIHLPEPVSLWPPAPGWWLLLLVVSIAIVYASRHAIAALIRRRKLASVLAELDTAYADFNAQAASGNTSANTSVRNSNHAGLEFLATVNRLMKRVVQVMYPDSGSANLTGNQWLEYLDACDHGTAFTQGAGKVLGDGMYRPSFDADAEALYQVTRHWIEQRYKEKAGAVRNQRTAGSVAA